MGRQSSRTATVPSGPFSFGYEEFTEWYSDLTTSLLEPARATFTRILDETLDQELTDVDRLRIRVSHSRIKSPSRLWHKMLGEKYSGSISTLDDIPGVIDDLVGVRVTCNNVIDVVTFRNIVISLAPTDPSEMPAGLCIDPESERHHSKESGYRAYHINLHTLIPARSAWKHARGELQVRTLLQDSWGELTHEDTYKPGSSMPKLVTQLAKRMADLLATVDDLAQDLRNELDELAFANIGIDKPAASALDISPEAEPDSQSNDTSRTGSGDLRDALVGETRRVIDALTRPAPLAQIAWQVQANFGREVTADWGGFGTFKELLRSAAPDAQIIDVPPGTVVPGALAQSPSHSDKADALVPIGVPPEGVPGAIHRLRQRDANAPAIGSERLSVLLDAVVAVLDPTIWDELDFSPGDVGTRELNQLARRARDLAAEHEAAPSRSSLDYILKSLYFSQNLRPGLDKPSLASILGDWLFARASRLGFISDPIEDRNELESWIAAAS